MIAWKLVHIVIFNFFTIFFQKKIKVLKEQSSYYFIKTKHNFACVHLYLLVLLRCNFLASSQGTCFQGLWALSGSCCTCTQEGTGNVCVSGRPPPFSQFHLLPPRTSQKWGLINSGNNALKQSRILYILDNHN